MDAPTIYVDRPPPTPAHAGAPVDDETGCALIDIFTDGIARRVEACQAVFLRLSSPARTRCFHAIQAVRAAGLALADNPETGLSWAKMAADARELFKKVADWEAQIWVELGHIGKNEDLTAAGRSPLPGME